jgi:hypothetical protein
MYSNRMHHLLHEELLAQPLLVREGCVLASVS